MGYRQGFSTRNVATPQTQAIPGREAEMAKNDAGGVGFILDKWARLDRFLILGSENGTYYVGENKLTKENATAALECIKEDGLRVVRRIVEISVAGRAQKNEPALYILAMCAGLGDADTKGDALDALKQVARIGTHLFHFAEYVEGFRGWGRALRHAVGDWYNFMPIDDLAGMVVKYKQRDGWSNRDLLRLSHPKTTESARRGIYDWVVGRKPAVAPHNFIAAADAAQVEGADIPALIREFNLPREAIPTEALNRLDVWQALAEKMPMTAMIRNLGKMTSIGLLQPGNEFAAVFAARLRDAEAIKRARVHPMSVLIALKTYAQGRGEKGKLTWSPVPRLIDALDDAFDLAMVNATPTGKRLLVAVDVSGSMSANCSGASVLTAKEAAAAIATIFLRIEPMAHVIAFDTSPHEPGLSPKQRRDDVAKAMSRWNGGTDVAQPIAYALANKQAYDGIVMLTDNETWAGKIHVSQLMERYRREVSRDCRMACLAMTASGANVVDPRDPLSFGVAGLDAGVVDIVSQFIAGRL